MLCSGPSSFCFAAASVATRATISSWYSLLVAPQDYGISDKDLVQAFQVWFCLRVDGRLCQAHVGAKPFDLQGDMLFWLHVVERVSPVSRFAMELAEVSRRIANVRRQLRRSQPYGRPCCGLSSETMVAGLLVSKLGNSALVLLLAAAFCRRRLGLVMKRARRIQNIFVRGAFYPPFSGGPVFGGPILGMVWDLLLQIFNPSHWGAVLGFILGFMVARSLPFFFFGGATKQFRTTALW